LFFLPAYHNTTKTPVNTRRRFAVELIFALVLALLAILDLVRAGTALSLAVMLLSRAFVPGLSGMRRIDRY